MNNIDTIKETNSSMISDLQNSSPLIEREPRRPACKLNRKGKLTMTNPNHPIYWTNAERDESAKASLEAQKRFWTYQAPETPAEPPAGTKISVEDWQTLTPGMRREIARSFARNPATGAARYNRFSVALDLRGEVS